ncbi:MAG: ATP-binding protein [Thermoleophilia bacterium]
MSDATERTTWQVSLAIPARAEYLVLGRLALSGLTRVVPISSDTLADLKLALTEAASNAIVHGSRDGDGVVRIRYELLADGRLAVEVADDGPGSGNGSPVDEEEALQAGLGLAIIEALADEVEVERLEPGGGTRLRFIRTLS